MSSRPRGFTLAEVLMVVAIMGTLFVISFPKITELKGRTTLRASRATFASAFATARAVAMQKGKRSTLTLGGNTVGVTVFSGLTNTPTQVMHPLLFGGVSTDGKLSAPNALLRIRYLGVARWSSQHRGGIEFESVAGGVHHDVQLQNVQLGRTESWRWSDHRLPELLPNYLCPGQP